jgi:hypothetical protein
LCYFISSFKTKYTFPTIEIVSFILLSSAPIFLHIFSSSQLPTCGTHMSLTLPLRPLLFPTDASLPHLPSPLYRSVAPPPPLRLAVPSLRVGARRQISPSAPTPDSSPTLSVSPLCSLSVGEEGEAQQGYSGTARSRGNDEDEEPKKQGMATVAMAQESSSPHFFSNFSDDEDHTHFCLMARGSKVQETTTSSSLSSSSSTPSSDIENIDEEKELEANMIKKFGKKGHKEIKKLLDKLEEKKEILHEQ